MEITVPMAFSGDTRNLTVGKGNRLPVTLDYDQKTTKFQRRGELGGIFILTVTHHDRLISPEERFTLATPRQQRQVQDFVSPAHGCACSLPTAARS